MSSLRFKSLFILFLFSLFFYQCVDDGKNEILVTNSIAKEAKTEVNPVLENRRAQHIHNNGKAKQDSGLYAEAIVLYEQSKSIREVVLEQHPSLEDTIIRDSIIEGIIRSQHNIGFCYYYSKQISKAATATSNNVDLQNHFQKKWGFEKYSRKAWAYHLLGQILSEHSGFDEALYNYQNAKNYFSMDKDDWGVADIHNDLSDLFLDWRMPDSAIFHSQKAIELYSSLDLTEEIANSFVNLGVGLIEKKNFDTALKEFDSAYSIYNNKRKDYLIPIAKTHHNKAFGLIKMGMYDKALSSIDSAIWIVEKELNPINHSSLLAHSISLKALIFYYQGRFLKALNQYDSSIAKFLNIAPLNEPNNLNFLDESIIISNKIDFLEAFAGRAKTLAALGQMEASIQTYDKSIQLINHVRRNYRDAQSKIRLAEITKRIFEGAIQASLQSGNQEKALEYAEKSKGFTLMESLKHNQAVAQVVNDDEALELEHNLRRNIRDIEQTYSSAGKSEEKAALLEKRQRFQNSLDSLLDIFNESEAYRQLMAEFPVLSSKEIQDSLLADNQALIEYFIGDDHSYIFFIPKTGQIEVTTLEKGRTQLNREVKELIYAIYPDENKTGEEETALRSSTPEADSIYALRAFSLYQELLYPLIGTKTDVSNRLIIIPDDVLGYLPFDVLLTSNSIPAGHYRDFDYLGKKHPISYCYSAALLKEMQRHQRRRAAKNKMLAFAFAEPSFQEQVNSVSKVFKTLPGFVKALKTNTAPKAYIEDNAEDYRILHYSTHGEVNDREPNYSYLRMLPAGSNNEDTIYQLYEIFNTPIKADLVVTSACNTGIGKLFRGEGIMSLARGFSYAGASSIVTTLWAVQTGESKDLLDHFYQNLQQGQTKDEALFNAKLAFFEVNKSQQAYRPTYWAGFIPVGDMSSMDFPAAPSLLGIYWKTGLLILVVLVLAFWLMSRRKKA